LLAVSLNLSDVDTTGKMSAHDNDELIDYEDDGDVGTTGPATAAGGNSVAVAGATDGEGEKEKKNFSGIHSTGFRYCPTWSRVVTYC
jgi:hypothetical protein